MIPVCWFVVECGCGEWEQTHQSEKVEPIVQTFLAHHPNEGPVRVWAYRRDIVALERTPGEERSR